MFTSKKISFDKFCKRHVKTLLHMYIFLKIFIASYGARMRGSVNKIEFRVLSREFESIETSPGFAQLLGENWN